MSVLTEILFIVVDEFTGQEIEREWRSPNHFSIGDKFMDSFHMGIVREISIEDKETRRVFVVPEF